MPSAAHPLAALASAAAELVAAGKVCVRAHALAAEMPSSMAARGACG